jgi:hypothetical protein
MDTTRVAKTIQRSLKAHSPAIYSAIAGVGTIVTAYLASRASFEAARRIDFHEGEYGFSESKLERISDRAKLVWKLYVPPAITATTTVVSIVAANKVQANKTIAAQTALSVSQQLYSDYRDRVIEEYGANKDQSIRDRIAEERVKALPPPQHDMIIGGTGHVLCCEQYTGRYFNSDMETLRKAQNDINAKLHMHDYATMDDFYHMVGLGGTSGSSQMGWNSDKNLDLQFSAVMTDDGRPCLSFEYNYTKPL